MRFRDLRPTVIKQLESKGVSVLYPVTPQRVSIFSNPDRQIVKSEYQLLSKELPWPSQNRKYKRKMRKPLKPRNLRRATREMKAAWDYAEQV
jgi:hypothetical protein